MSLLQAWRRKEAGDAMRMPAGSLRVCLGAALGVALGILSIFGAGVVLSENWLPTACADQPATAPLPTLGRFERLDPRFDMLVPGDASIEVLASGFAWAEGPVWVADERGGLPAGSLLFSDVPNNRVHAWNPSTGMRLFLEPSGFTGPAGYGKERGSNGLALDREGRLLSCEHGDRRVSRLEPGGGKRTVCDAWQGRRFNSPNDLVVHSSGGIYFTDPPYGLPDGPKDARREIEWYGIYRVDPKGDVALLCRTMTRPNGLAFSPDEKWLYVANSDPKQPVINRFAVLPDGSLDEGNLFFDAGPLLLKERKGMPDGLRVHRDGTLFATGPGGVLLIAADGTHLGSILTGHATANCCFGEDGRTLFITADSLLCRLRLATAGL